MDDRPDDGTHNSADEPSVSDSDGIVSIRRGLVGLGFIWLTAVAAFTAVGTAIHGIQTSAGYLLVSLFATAVAVRAGSASLRTFGYR